MAELLPQNIPLLSSNAIASYDYVDLAAGLGYVQYKLFSASLSGAKTFGLTTNNVYSYAIADTGSGLDSEADFDTSPFNLQRTVSGTAYVSIGFGVKTGGTGNVQVQLLRVDSAGTTTNLSALVSGANIGGSGTTVGMWLVPLPLTQTNIRKDDKIRLSVQVSENGNSWEWGYDPQGRSGTIISGGTVTTTSSVYIPFRIYN